MAEALPHLQKNRAVKVTLNREQLAREIKAEYGIDLNQYSKPEIVQEVNNLLDLIGLIGTFLKWSIFAFGISLGVAIVIFAGQISWLLLPLVVIYALLLSPLVGLTFGALLVARRILGQLSSILGLCLGLVTAMVADLKTLADRCASNQAIPSLPVLLNGTIQVVVLPIIEETLKAKLWILSRPIIWIVRFIFGQLTLQIQLILDHGRRQLGRQLRRYRQQVEEAASAGASPSVSSGKGDNTTSEKPGQGPEALTQLSQTVETLQSHVDELAKTISRHIAMPFRFGFLLSIIALYGPLLLVFYLTQV